MNLPMCFWKLVLGRGKGTAVNGDGDGGGRGKGRGGGRDAGRKAGGVLSLSPHKGSSSARVPSTATTVAAGRAGTTGAAAGRVAGGNGTTTTTTATASAAVVDLDDVAGLDATLYKSLLHVRDNEGVEDLCLTFEAPIEELVLQSTTGQGGGGLRVGGSSGGSQQSKGYPLSSTTTGTTTGVSFAGVVRKADEGVRRCSSSSSGSSSSSSRVTSDASSSLPLDLGARVVGVSHSRCVPLISKDASGGHYPPLPLHAATTAADAAVAVTDANKESYLAAMVSRISHMTTKRS